MASGINRDGRSPMERSDFVFNAEPKVISRQSNWPCKQVPHAGNKKHAGDEIRTHDNRSSLHWRQALTVVPTDRPRRRVGKWVETKENHRKIQESTEIFGDSEAAITFTHTYSRR